ncbi:uncharacterized protein BP5553_08382 [Venustampulla echinocandica]|uniref:Uncharacterized protein n=1 Tax=Venustampulla echinocandica TaxID=2656787 RepID=A0A370TE31_9HELO|nr:uncharacterized protein BP5553_08382 [Venustampulla echinocandica]RDL32943.1 hypothetical protein BP5553_08382 [Venustampulla echinocandica]
MDYQLFQQHLPSIVVRRLPEQMMPLVPTQHHQASNHKHAAKCPISSRRMAEKLPSGGLRSSLKKHDMDQHKNVHWDSATVNNETKTKSRIRSPILGPESHPWNMTFSPRLRSESRNIGGSLAHASNTSRPMDPRQSRVSTSKEARHGPPNTAVKRKTPSSTQRLSHDHRSLRTDSKGTIKSRPDELSARSQDGSSSGYQAPANSSSKRNPKKLSQLPSQISSLPPPVPDAPQMPPPTPRPARLPTPDLDDISDRRFCYCNNAACHSRAYPHDSQGRRLSSKMSEQIYAAQAYMTATRN